MCGVKSKIRVENTESDEKDDEGLFVSVRAWNVMAITIALHSYQQTSNGAMHFVFTIRPVRK